MGDVFDGSSQKLHPLEVDYMRLARELLKWGERETVLEYLDMCRGFWKLDRGRLDQWRAQVQRGEVPDFGANLYY